MNLFIPILYVCLNGHCEFLQQLTVYSDEQECRMMALRKKEWYTANTTASVDTSCISAPAQVKEETAKPKPKEKV